MPPLLTYTRTLPRTTATSTAHGGRTRESGSWAAHAKAVVAKLGATDPTACRRRLG
jgi:hypothetical protein